VRAASGLAAARGGGGAALVRALGQRARDSSRRGGAATGVRAATGVAAGLGHWRSRGAGAAAWLADRRSRCGAASGLAAVIGDREERGQLRGSAIGSRCGGRGAQIERRETGVGCLGGRLLHGHERGEGKVERDWWR